MPIVEPPVAGYPLDQGDILRGVTLFVTQKDGTTPSATKFSLCLVISRPCVVAHKAQIVVVGVKSYSEAVPREIDNFDKVLDFMVSARDGVTTPDVFYLGQVPGQVAGRYCARLDSLHTIEIPGPSEERQKFVDERRVAAMNPEFQRALHTRIFGSFASLGFDDHKWPSDTDLEWIVTQGKADIKKLEGDVEQFRATRSSHEAAGKEFQTDQLDKAEKKLTAMREKVAPYEVEFAVREHRRVLPSVGAGPGTT